MKTNLKSLMMAALFAGLGSAAFAQQASFVPASAVVLSDLIITPVGAISFGNLSATTAGIVTLAPIGEAGNLNTGTETTVARFDLQGAADAEVTVEYDATTDLVNGSSDILVMIPLVVGAATVGEQGTAAAVPSDSQVTIVDGAYSLWVGGTIPQLLGTPIGTYTGQFDITVEYN